MAKRDLVHRFLWFLQHELENGCLSEESAEGIEVARQCLESAFEVKELDDSQNRPTLLEIYAAGLASLSERDPERVRHPEPTEEEKIRADKLKTQGNLCMAKNQFREAVECYSKAIELNSLNAVYYCNRAAAYSKLNENMEAIKDCEMAIKINNRYSKAYARMGLAYSAMKDHAKAVEAYQNALKIDPVNQGYQQNLSLAEARLRGEAVPLNSGTDEGLPGGTPSASAAGSRPAAPGPPGSFDFSSFLNNPALMNMATQLMSSPQMQNLMSNLMTGAMNEGGGGGVGGGGGGGGNPQNMDNILNIGQQIAQQMQTQNPELVESLRERFQTSGNNSDERPASGDPEDPPEPGPEEGPQP